MKRNRTLLKIALLCFSGIVLGSCSQDDSYDLSKNIDMTMGLGSNGLALKLGNTEKMYLRDILKVEDSKELDTLTSGTKQSLYYLVKEGNTNFNMKVEKIDPFQIAPVNVVNKPIYTAPVAIALAQNDQRIEPTVVSDSDKVTISITNIPTAVKEVRTITLTNVNISLAFKASKSGFAVNNTTPLVFTFPSFVYVKGGHTYTFAADALKNASSLTIPLDSVVFPITGTFGQTVSNQQLSNAGYVKATGTFKATPTVAMTLAANTTLNINITASFPSITPSTVSGIFDPVINPTTDPINIKNDLPSFLTDGEVQLQVANPTILFVCGGETLPVSLSCYADLKANKNGSTITSVRVPASTATASLKKSVTSVNYFYQSATDGPFIPFNVAYPSSTYSNKYQVSNLYSLVTRIPDELAVDLSTGHIKTDKTALHKVVLGTSYGASVNYTAYIPFTFNKGLSIVYTDSVKDMNKDMKDYQADSIAITATAYNTAPLALTIDVIPVDVNGKVISGITVTPATAVAGTGDVTSPVTSEMKILLRATNRQLVSQIDKLRFKVKGSARDNASGDPLMSTQYIELKDLRFHLLGQIIGNFN